MADANMRDFDKRMEKIVRHHQKLSRGYVAAINDDGLIVAKPRRRIWVPWRPILFFLIVAFAFKIGLHAYLGPDAYQARVEKLAAGTEWAQVGAWVMAADPVTIAVSERIQPLMD
ncbi:MAG: hypothetical protein AAGK37_18815 [Pseudomonadota bacterium]